MQHFGSGQRDSLLLTTRQSSGQLLAQMGAGGVLALRRHALRQQGVEEADFAAHLDSYGAIRAAGHAVSLSEIDLGIWGVSAPLLDSRLQTWSYASGRLAVLVPKRHALAEQDSVRFADLLDYDLIGLHAGASAQEMMRQQAQALGRTLNARIQVRGFDAIAQLVEAGLGVAVLPGGPAERFSRVFDVKLLALDEDWAVREYCLGVLRQERLPAVLQRFVDSLCPPAPKA